MSQLFGRAKAINLMEELEFTWGISPAEMMYYVIYNYLPAHEAIELLEAVAEENGVNLHKDVGEGEE